MCSNAALESTVRLQGLTHGCTDIPREYHRKVLKKIAQLTKVIFILNTKNDENEETVQAIRSQHNVDVQRLSSDWSAKLERVSRDLESLREAEERKVQGLAEDLELVKRERDSLKVAEARRSEERDGLIAKARDLDQQVTHLKMVCASKDEEVSKAKLLLRAAEGARERAQADHRARLDQEREGARSQIEDLKKAHVAELDEARRQYENKMEVSGSTLVAAEAEKWQDRLHKLQNDAATREECLTSKVSQLTSELRVTKDGLMLAEQKLIELEASAEGSKSNADDLHSRLLTAQEEVRTLRGNVSLLQTELSIARDKHTQQSAEMQKMSSTIGGLEGLHVTNAGEIEALRSVVKELKEKLAWMQKEKDAQDSSRTAAEQGQLKIKNLEKEVGRLIREKQELHMQYAHEIEAAHGQLSEREQQMQIAHLKTLQDLKIVHQEAISAILNEKSNELASVRKDVEAKAEKDMELLSEKHMNEILELKSALAKKMAEYDGALSDLEKLRREVEEKNNGLCSASGLVQKLTKDLEDGQEQAKSLQKQVATERMENEHLKLALKDLKEAHQKALTESKKKMEKMEVELTQRLEDLWRQRLRDECDTLRSQMTRHHEENVHSALKQVATLKDQAMKDALVAWNNERAALTETITLLEDQLQQIQHSSEMAIEVAKSVCNEELAKLKKEMDESARVHEKELQDLLNLHRQQLNTIEDQHRVKTDELKIELSNAHSKEVQLIHESNLICIKSMKDEWEFSRSEVIHALQTKHKEQLEQLCMELMDKSRAELTIEKEKHDLERSMEQKTFEEKLSHSHKEINMCKTTIRNLENQVERRDSELTIIREKANNLTGAVAELRKELEVKGSEILSIRREANVQVQLQHQQLSLAHKAEVDSINKQHEQQIQSLLNDFNKAKELLILKIRELERKLSAAEEKYQMRESRTEDLEEIQKLKGCVVELQCQLKEIAAEMRIYQLELANREKNYNKVFAANPLVGVLDPMLTKRKVESVRHSSAPSLTEVAQDELPSSPLLRKLRHLDPIESKPKVQHVVALKSSAEAIKSAQNKSSQSKLHPGSPSHSQQSVPVQL